MRTRPLAISRGLERGLRGLKAIDSHAHLEELKDLESCLRRAASRGVIAVVTAGSDASSSRFALEARSRFKELGIQVFGAIGLHPWSLRELGRDGIEEALDFIEARAGEAVAIGEVGLDYWLPEARRDGEGRRLQREVFARQLRIARKAEKPVVVHSRGAWKDCLEMVKEAEVEALFHWFSGPLEVLKELLACGYCVSATLALDYSEEHRRVILNTPLSRILSETDSPVRYKGRFNREAEPADVVDVVAMIASLKEVGLEEAAKHCLNNAIRFYSLPSELG
ncbi:MAG: hypothetical protein DRJ98_07640 [Thermoprotei archaeon]|nr:MAG: hypothetical protein DRJ98_07640 [Thermoprotei archaeon]RLF17590.1 MAG: hypothetical protein DRN06_03565 [Thermoprotei archaeon]